MSIGTVLGESFALYRRFFGRFFALGAIVSVVTTLLPALAGATDSDVARGLLLAAGIVVGIVGFVWLQAAVVAAVDDVRDGRIDTTIPQLFERTRARLPYLVGAGFLIAVAGIGVGIVAVIVGKLVHPLLALLVFLVGIFLLITRWALVTPLIVLDERGITTALRESWELVKGHSWRVFWVIFLTGLIAGIASKVVQAILRAVLPNFVSDWLGPAAANALTVPFIALALTVSYFELRGERTAGAELPAGAAFRADE